MLGSFPENAPPPCRPHAAVAIDDDLAAGETGVALRSADDETAGRVDEEFGRAVQHRSRQHFADHFLDAEIFDLAVLHVGGVLSGNDDVRNTDRLVVFVNDRDLRLRIRAKPAALPLLRMRVNSRPRRCANMIGAGISSGVSSQAKPNIRPWSPAPCSAWSFAFRFGLIDTLRDIGRLIGDDVGDENFVGVENVVLVHVTDFLDRLAHDLVDVEHAGERLLFLL